MFIGILLRLLLGYVRIEVEGYYIERFINICRNQKILIWNLKREKGVRLYLNIGIKDFKKLSSVARKTKCKIKIKSKKGIPFLLNRYRKRKIFVILLIIVSISIYTSSKYIWNIDVIVEDNLEIANIRTDLEELGLKKGIRKSEVKTGEIINELRLKRNDISWLGIDVQGTNLIVKIVKADERPEIVDKADYCNIIATKDGIITKITAQNGTAMVSSGDTVKKGDILIAGYMEGKYTEPRYVHSLGNVQAKVWYTKKEKIPYKQEISRDTGKEEKKLQIKFNNFQINFYKTLSKFEIYDTIYAEQNLKIFSNYYLPISVVKIINKEQVKEKKIYSKEEAKNIGINTLSNQIEEEIENKDIILRENNKHQRTKRIYRSECNI
ncbi:MAG: sporulation protein YqfD [Clostridia bacterium]|nr:sporulation protein YqfD [Clostridia bacterium]